MNLSRRQLLTAMALGTSTAVLSGCRSIEQIATPVSILSDGSVARPLLTQAAAARILGRAGYGHRPGDREMMMSAGLVSYLDGQLRPDSIPESATLASRLRGLEDQIPNDFGLLFEQDDHVLMGSLASATLLRAVYSNHQLLERLTEFWSDHFNVFSFKTLRLPQYVVLMNLNVLRPYALGSFRQLLGASARCAAILCYLDNQDNRAGRPNENYARELMELHTLGIHGGYTQGDVREVARCLTGWTIDSRFRPGEFRFDESAHDKAVKTVLGRVVYPSGEKEMDDVLDRLASHPSTATHIATKLLARFRGDVDEDHVRHVASVFQKTDGNIRMTVRSVFLDCGVLDAPPILKRPFDFAASALRVMDADTDCGDGVVSCLGAMGQALYQWPRPDGFPDKSSAWANCLSSRWQFAMDLCAGSLENTTIDWSRLAAGGSHEAMIGRLFSKGQSGADLQVLREAKADSRTLPEFAALALMSPSFQWR